VWKLIFEHLLTSCGMLGCCILSCGILIGIVRSANKVFGYFIKEKTKEKVIFGILGICLCSILGGFTWLSLASEGLLSKDNILHGILVGGLVGGGISGIVALMIKPYDHEGSSTISGRIVNWIASLIIGKFAGLIVGGFAGLIVGVIAGGIIGLIAGLIAGLIVGGLTCEIVSWSAGETAEEIDGKIIGEFVGLAVGGFTGWFARELAERIATPRIATPGVDIVFVGVIVGGIAGRAAIGEFISKVAAMNISAVANRTSYRIAGGFAGLIAGLIAGENAGDIVYKGDDLIVGVIAGGIIGLIAGLIAGLIYCISYLASFSSYILSSIVLILMSQRKIICRNCLRYSEPLRSRYDKGIRYCERCGRPDYLLKSIKRVIGLIGGDIEDHKIDKDSLYINLWNEERRKARDVDIDILEIRDSPNITYDLAINTVLETLKKSTDRPVDYDVKQIAVLLRGNPPIPEETKRVLEHNFGRIK